MLAIKIIPGFEEKNLLHKLAKGLSTGFLVLLTNFFFGCVQNVNELDMTVNGYHNLVKQYLLSKLSERATSIDLLCGKAKLEGEYFATIYQNISNLLTVSGEFSEKIKARYCFYLYTL